MDFTYTEEQEAFRQKVRDFVAQNLPKNSGRAGSPQSGAQADREFLIQWQRKLYEAGLLGVSWPREYGGGGKTEMELAIFNEEMAKAGAPVPNVSVFGPVMLAHGSEEQKQRYLRKALSAAGALVSRACRSPARVPTSARSRRGPSWSATSSSSTGRSAGTPAPIMPISACC